MSLQKSVLKDSSTTVHFLLLLSSVAMLGLSIYLTNHYFHVKFPSGLTGGSLCDFGSFFNCDTATLSPASNIAGVPISIVGAITGTFLLLGYLFNNAMMEGTNHFLLRVNFVGCIGLFLYSLIALGSLCPVCTAYYVFSGLALYLFHKNSEITSPDFKILAGYAVTVLVVGGFIWNSVNTKLEKSDALAKDLLKQYYGLANLGSPKVPSKFRLASATEKFEDAPIQITIYSDFQCPACKALSKITPLIAKRYEGKVNMQYMFYPLDHNCNPGIQRPLHEYACQAAYLSTCTGPEKFERVHDDIFDAQNELNQSWIDNYAKKENVTECIKSVETKESVLNTIKAANAFNIRSTPSMLVNGVKIEGVLPPSQLYIILDDLLEKAKK
jgi:uncharacterized membrane protein